MNTTFLVNYSYINFKISKIHRYVICLQTFEVIITKFIKITNQEGFKIFYILLKLYMYILYSQCYSNYQVNNTKFPHFVLYKLQYYQQIDYTVS